MPDLHPIVKRLDELIRETIPGLRYAVKWKQAYYAGFTDLDGARPDGWRYLVEVQDAGLPLSPVIPDDAA
jgi:hypothetical protein